MYHSIDVDIRVNDKTLRQYPFQNRLFVEAKDGSEYSVKIKNNRWERVLAVVTVDGINVIDGQAGGASKAGYVINGYASLDVKGFRTSNDNVNAFKFSSKQRSYAAKSEETKGDTRNCGVIGIEIYAEKEKPVIRGIIPRTLVNPTPIWYYSDNTNSGTIGGQSWTASAVFGNQMRCATNSVTSSLESSLEEVEPVQDTCFLNSVGTPKRSFDMGTEFSNKEIDDKVTEVEFETGTLLTTFTIYYASRSALLDMGVPIAKETQISFPQAFPTKFCKPPRK